MFICKFCEEEFRNDKELRKHTRVCICNPANDQTESFHCRYCGKGFCNKDELRRHMKICNPHEEFNEDED